MNEFIELRDANDHIHFLNLAQISSVIFYKENHKDRATVVMANRTESFGSVTFTDDSARKLYSALAKRAHLES